MANFLIQSATADNLARSITKPVLLSEMQDCVSGNSFEILRGIYPEGKCWVWGLPLGPMNLKQWERLEPQDDVGIITLLGIQFYMRVMYKEHNAEVARRIWGPRLDGKLYELTYFSNLPTLIDISLVEYNAFTGYNYDRMPQNAFILQPLRADPVRQAILAQIGSSALGTIAVNDLTRDKTLFVGLHDNGDPPAVTGFARRATLSSGAQKDAIDIAAFVSAIQERSNAHEQLASRIAECAVRWGLLVSSSILVDLIIGDDVFIEVKTLNGDAVRQARNALAQLYYYRFVYRKRFPSARLLAAFSRYPDQAGNDITQFLSECGIESVWAADGAFDGTMKARQIIPWLFA